MNETNDLPYQDLFPIIHPLKKPAQEIYEKILLEFHRNLENNYDFHLPQGYMTPEKLGAAIMQLQTLNVLQTCDISVLLEHHDVTNFANQTKPDLDDKKHCAYFWVFNTAGFFLLNVLLNFTNNPVNINPNILARNIHLCFSNADAYKISWNERNVQRKGAQTRIDKINNDKNLLFEKWHELSVKERAIPKLAANKLQGYAEIVKFSTILTWCRQWRKELHNVNI